MDITSINLMNYDLTVIEYGETNDASQIPARSFRIRFGAITNPDMERLLKDMMVMNEVRGRISNPSVQDAYEQLLTVLALTDQDTKK